MSQVEGGRVGASYHPLIRALGIEFHYALFVGQTAIPTLLVSRIEFNDVDSEDDRIERVERGGAHNRGASACCELLSDSEIGLR